MDMLSQVSTYSCIMNKQKVIYQLWPNSMFTMGFPLETVSSICDVIHQVKAEIRPEN